MAASCERELATAARGQGRIGDDDVMIPFADLCEWRARFEGRVDAEEDD